MQTQYLCPLCQEPNSCALVQTGDARHCWCMQRKIASEILADIPTEHINTSCICQKCAYQKREILPAQAL